MTVTNNTGDNIVYMRYDHPAGWVFINREGYGWEMLVFVGSAWVDAWVAEGQPGDRVAYNATWGPGEFSMFTFHTAADTWVVEHPEYEPARPGETPINLGLSGEEEEEGTVDERMADMIRENRHRFEIEIPDHLVDKVVEEMHEDWRVERVLEFGPDSHMFHVFKSAVESSARRIIDRLLEHELGHLRDKPKVRKVVPVPDM